MYSLDYGTVLPIPKMKYFNCLGLHWSFLCLTVLKVFCMLFGLQANLIEFRNITTDCIPLENSLHWYMTPYLVCHNCFV
jgi:hypothetical protein